MKEFLEMYNEYLAKNRMSVHKEVPMDGFRKTYFLKGRRTWMNELTKEVSERFDNCVDYNLFDEHNIKFLMYGCTFYGEGNEKYDCKDWVFDQIELSQYSSENGRQKANSLLKRNLKEIKKVEFPEKGDIVVYSIFFARFHEVYRPMPAHWGLVEKVDGGVTVRSKWGKGMINHVIEHPLELVPKNYGDMFSFFRKID